MTHSTSEVQGAPAGADPKHLTETPTGRFARDLDLNQEAVLRLVTRASQMRREPGWFAQALAGNYIALLFEKPSLRTRLTFELAIKQLGGDAVASIGLVGAREPVKDVARNLERWTQAIVARVFSQQTIDELAKWSRVPVINALSDLYHPCQVLADVQALQEHFGQLEGLKVAFVGDGNNVAHSLMLTLPRLGVDLRVATPEDYAPNPEILAEAKTLGPVSVGHDPKAAVSGADAVYTDVWASMGQEEEAGARAQVFQPFQVNAALMQHAADDAVFMHCLPAHRGEEVTDEVMESSRSIAFEQAENRLHAQKSLLLELLHR